MQWEIWVDGHKIGFSFRCIDMWGIKMVMMYCERLENETLQVEFFRHGMSKPQTTGEDRLGPSKNY